MILIYIAIPVLLLFGIFTIALSREQHALWQYGYQKLGRRVKLVPAGCIVLSLLFIAQLFLPDYLILNHRMKGELGEVFTGEVANTDQRQSGMVRYNATTGTYSLYGVPRSLQLRNPKTVRYVLVTNHSSEQTGTYTNGAIGYRVTVDVRIFDLQTGENIANNMFRGKDPPQYTYSTISDRGKSIDDIGIRRWVAERMGVRLSISDRTSVNPVAVIGFTIGVFFMAAAAFFIADKNGALTNRIIQTCEVSFSKRKRKKADRIHKEEQAKEREAQAAQRLREEERNRCQVELQNLLSEIRRLYQQISQMLHDFQGENFSTITQEQLQLLQQTAMDLEGGDWLREADRLANAIEKNSGFQGLHAEVEKLKELLANRVKELQALRR